MKLVTFARAQPPHGVGDKRLVPDEMAERLLEEGIVSAVESWPGQVPGHPPRKPTRPVVKPTRPARLPDARLAR
jgi:predicted RNA polymerase sigma factor